MKTPAMTRAEFISLLPPPEELRKRRRDAEVRRVRVCCRLCALIGEIVDQHRPRPGTPLRQVAAELAPNEGTLLLELIDRLDHESRVFGERR